MWGLLAGAALGALKGEQDKKAHRQMAELESVRAKYSPWTGAQTRNIGPTPGLMGPMMQAGLAGAMFEQQFGGKDPGGTNVSPTGTTAMAPPQAATPGMASPWGINFGMNPMGPQMR